MNHHYEIVSVQEDSSITPYGNASVETATGQVVDEPADLRIPITGNVYADHRYDIIKVAKDHNCDMSTATAIWEYEYFKGETTPEILSQRERWMKFMPYIIRQTDFTIADHILKPTSDNTTSL